MVTVVIELLTNLLLFAFGYATFWFVISIILKRNDIADVAWGLGYVLLCIYLYKNYEQNELSTLIYALVCLWGIRLSVHIGMRNLGKAEDFRYLNWRKEWGKHFYWRSFLQVYLLQAIILLIVSLPVTVVALVGGELGWRAYIMVPFWFFGFLYQAVADYQLKIFRKKRLNKEEILNTGLWKYSRHPNYFGEILMWWSLAIMVLPINYGWLGLLSPFLIAFLLLKVSGVPMLEKRYEGNAAFETYKSKTPAVFPRFW
ncbi:DUF1295 domain-containing protein [Roseivirga echinicomitans]